VRLAHHDLVVRGSFRAIAFFPAILFFVTTTVHGRLKGSPRRSPQPPTSRRRKKIRSRKPPAKAKAKKPAAANAKVYTEDDLSRMKGPGVSVVGDAPKKGARRARPTDPDGDGGESSEESWRGRARQILDAIAQTDEQIAQKKEEIKKFGSGGFDVTTGMKDNIAYINDRNGQLKDWRNAKRIWKSSWTSCKMRAGKRSVSVLVSLSAKSNASRLAKT